MRALLPLALSFALGAPAFAEGDILDKVVLPQQEPASGGGPDSIVLPSTRPQVLKRKATEHKLSPKAAQTDAKLAKPETPRRAASVKKLRKTAAGKKARAHHGAKIVKSKKKTKSEAASARVKKRRRAG